MAVYVGIDGGGTSTEAVAFDTASLRSVISTGAATRQTSVGWETSRRNLLQLIEEVLQKLGRSAIDVVSLSACLSGVDLRDQGKQMESELQPHFPQAIIEVTNDALAALAAGTQGGSGIVLVAGTGSIAIGESDDGTVARAGGYGHLIGDEGSGFEMGRKGLMAAVQWYEARGKATLLWNEAKKSLGIQHPQQLIPLVYGSNNATAAVASFAKVIIEHVHDDDTAGTIVEEAVQQQISLIGSVLRQLPKVEPRVILAGGLFSDGMTLARLVQAQLPKMTVSKLERRSVLGALTRSIRQRDPALLSQMGNIFRQWEPKISP